MIRELVPGVVKVVCVSRQAAPIVGKTREGLPASGEAELLYSTTIEVRDPLRVRSSEEWTAESFN